MDRHQAAYKDAWSAFQYNKAASFVYSDAYTQHVLGLLSPKPGERILDLGCGTGELSFRLQEFVGESGLVLGVDSSENMVSSRQVSAAIVLIVSPQLKTAKMNGIRNSFCCDIQNLAMPEKFNHLSGTFDGMSASSQNFDILLSLKCGSILAVFTNATLHWCKRDPLGVVRAAKNVLKPGGRFAGEFGGYLNCIGVI
jgi:SAM-dependent methyltransferase